MKNAHWYVYVGDFNQKRIVEYDIFEHAGFAKEVKKLRKDCADDYDEFCKELSHIAQYYFWSKCEWEIILSDWPPSDSFKKTKIDVFNQLMMNKEAFFEYVWNAKQ